MVAATDDILYDNVQGDLVVNDVLYNSQDEFDVINDFLHGIDQDKYENGNMMNFEGAQHNFIAMLDKYIDNCNELLSDGDTASSSESDDNHNVTEKGKLNLSKLMNPHKRKGK
ncbi:8516_t:CDS:2, partial [Racocetra fulgida]